MNMVILLDHNCRNFLHIFPAVNLWFLFLSDLFSTSVLSYALLSTSLSFFLSALPSILTNHHLLTPFSIHCGYLSPFFSNPLLLWGSLSVPDDRDGKRNGAELLPEITGTVHVRLCKCVCQSAYVCKPWNRTIHTWNQLGSHYKNI